MSIQEEELGQSRHKLRALLWIIIATCITFEGCAGGTGPLFLNHAVRQYDEAVLKSEKELLLLNIIRMHNDQPPHFTVSSDVKATFTFTRAGGITSPSGVSGKFGTTPNYNLGFSLNATVSDSPTIDIAPMQGKDFAGRLLKPMDIAVANTILMQEAVQIDKLLRLIGHSFLMVGPTKAKGTVDYPPEVVDYLKGCFKGEGADCLLVNRPPMYGKKSAQDIERLTDDDRYKLFRQVVLQIKALEMNGQLHFYPLDFYEKVEGPPFNELKIGDAIGAWEKQYFLEKIPKPDTQEESFILTKRYTITVLTDFDFFSEVKEKDKKPLLDKISNDLELEQYMKIDQSVVIVLFKNKNAKSNWPIYGLFRLRNFLQVLQFLAESLKQDDPGFHTEYHVAPSPFTEALLKRGVLDNPPLTLAISSGKNVPGDSVVDVKHNGESFWVSSPPDQSIRWNKQVFRLLYEIFQMNRVEPSVSPTLISVPK